jgi:hypothetical protein
MYIKRKFGLMCAYTVLLGMPEGKKPLGRRRHKWEDNIKMIVTRLWFGLWIAFTCPKQDSRWRALVNTATNIMVPLKAVDLLTECTFNFSRKTPGVGRFFVIMFRRRNDKPSNVCGVI